jgi:predicted amidohydrolase
VSARPTKVRVGLWQYPIERIASFDAWRAKLAAGMAHAAAQGARICVVPEYASMELTSTLDEPAQHDLATQLDGLQPLLPAYLATYAELARGHRITIVGGSFPERDDPSPGPSPGPVHNRARVHGPDGRVVIIDKLQMTRFERERWGISPGRGQTVIDVGGVRLGVAICYDAEFPLLVRRLVAAGADIICVPSCTDGPAGYHRVRVACQARALENQCYVLQAPTVGTAPWSIAVDENVGSAGAFAPPDRGFPSDGVLALGTYNEPGWTFTDLDLTALAQVRADGQVFNHRDWDRDPHVSGDVAHSSL